MKKKSSKTEESKKKVKEPMEAQASGVKKKRSIKPSVKKVI